MTLVKLLAVFGVVSLMLWLHELIHVAQFSLGGADVTQFCAAGVRSCGGVGWVEADSKVSSGLAESMGWLEVEAWLISGLVALVLLRVVLGD